MRILITNDDGIHAPGLEALERIAAAVGDEVWIVAPETDQSGFAHSLTLHDPLRVRELDDRRFAVRGTPTDCVIMAVRQLMPEPPDLVLSGVNAGQNAADDVTYSGTVAAAIEGTLLGIPSIALSQAYEWAGEGEIPFETAEAHAPAVIRKVFAAGIPKGTLVNLNFPNRAPDAVEGVEVTRQGASLHGLGIEARMDIRRKPYYWLFYGRTFKEPAPGTDVDALARGYVSVTPLRLDMTDDESLGWLGSAIG
ncbi:5'/3'-nucleotidase SurE [Methylobrevis albus]|uniref:5'-nucleotidase SurE n=1 Tax=Methylobrevis albus TaxID=2793297 RepID=A0A931I509_9HYPH|nr:5'/3'-nucleotidase SurE [Methylobrevis albus]MBH0238971.1 5'/3'-nucleotidase SurE [Methylobrevis albus]